MRYIVMHKVDANMEAGRPPKPGIIEGMGELVQEGLKAGTFLDGAGLHRSARRVRLEFKNGQRTTTHGPYKGKNELCRALIAIRATSLEDAIAHAERFAPVLGDIEIELGPVVEPWDLGLIEKPARLRAGRFLLLLKSDPQTERGASPAPDVSQAIRQLEQEMTDEGVLLSTEWLAPSSRASRLGSAQHGKRTWVDGPFTESKELIAGFSILRLPDKPTAVAWAERYAAILGDNEVDLRELEEKPT